jgi:hypothetical protein
MRSKSARLIGDARAVGDQRVRPPSSEPPTTLWSGMSEISWVEVIRFVSGIRHDEHVQQVAARFRVLVLVAEMRQMTETCRTSKMRSRRDVFAYVRQ